MSASSNLLSKMDTLKADVATGNLSINLDLRTMINSAAGNSTILPQVTRLLGGNDPTATNAKLLLNTQLQLAVQQDGSLAVEFRSYDTFPQFRTLPTELRLKIWRYAMPGPRIVEIHLHGDSRKTSYGWRNFTEIRPVTPNPITLYINQESRAESLKRYELPFSTDGSHELIKATSSPIYLDYAIDIPLFSRYIRSNYTSKSTVYAALRELMSSQQICGRPEETNPITRIAIPLPIDHFEFDVLGSIELFPVLDTCFFILESSNSGALRELSTRNNQNLSAIVCFADLNDKESFTWENRCTAFVAGLTARHNNVGRTRPRASFLTYFKTPPSFVLQKVIRKWSEVRDLKG